MSKQEIKDKGDRVWEVVNLVASATGGAILALGDTPTIYKDVTVGAVVGAVLLATVLFRITKLVMNESK